MNEPAAWVQRWARTLPTGATVLDVACGSGRHLRWLAAQGLRVTGVDRDAAALAPLAAMAETLVADIENGPWPLAGRQFDAVLVTNYLWRPLFPALLDAVAVGGLYLHETFAVGHPGRPSRPEFLLQPGELLDTLRGFTVLGFEQGFEADPPRAVQRIAALKGPFGPAAKIAG